MNKQHLTEYTVVLPGNNVKEGLQVSYGVNELMAAKEADEIIRMMHPKAEIHLGDTVAV